MKNSHNKQPANELTLYLMKESKEDFDEYLEDEKLNHFSKKQIDNDTCFYYRDSFKNTPKWVEKFFGSNVDDDIKQKIFSACAIAILFKKISFKNEKYVFALTFGQGFYSLKKTSYEERFGLITSLNLVNSNTIRSIDKTNTGISPKQSREQLISMSNIMDFGIDMEQDIIKSITGKCLDMEIGATITGKDSLHISSKVDISNVDELLKKVIDKFKSEEYKDSFSWIDNIKNIKDKELIEQLNQKLIEEISSERILQNIWLAIPEVIEWANISYFRYIGNDKSFTDLDLIDLKNTFKDRENLTIDNIKKQKIISVNNEGNDVNNWSAYNCIYAEIKFNNEQYVLNDGKWFLINDNFKDVIETEYKSIIIDDNLPEHEPLDKECDYNKKFAESKNFTLMDAKNIPYGGGSSKIEFCDIYDFSSKKLYHIKRYGNSSALSHLFNQGLVSAELMLQEEEFRKKVNSKLPEKENFDPVSDRPNASEYSVIYGIISKSDNDLEIPFFSKVALKNIKRTLSGFGIGKIGLIKIKHKKNSSSNGNEK